MKCSDLDELLLAYVNGELPRTQREFIKEHLSGCADCQHALAKYAEVRQRLSSMKELQPFPDLQGSIMSKIRTARQDQPGSSGRTGMGRFAPRRLNWKTGLSGLLILALVISLVVTLPPLFGQDDKALAAEIALSNQEVQATLGGEEPKEVTVVDDVDIEGNTRVVIIVSDDRVVVADVDMGNQKVITVNVRELTDITEQEIIAIAKTDPNVQELFDKGAQVHDLEMVQVYPAIIDVWTEFNTQLTGVNPEDLVGFIASLTLQLGQNMSRELYTIIVNVTTGKVVTINEPGQFSDVGTRITTITTTHREEGIRVSVERISDGEEIILTPWVGIDRIPFTDFVFIVDFNSAIKTGNGENALEVYLPFWEEWADTSVQVFSREGLYLTPLPEFDLTNEVSATIEILDEERIKVSLVSGNFPSEAQVVLTFYFGEFGPPNQPSVGLGYTARVYVTAGME